MKTTQIQIVAGVASSLIFIVSNSLMLIKAFRTRDLRSYSLGYLAFANLGNLVYWVYVLSLPFGPIWFLHAFYTVAAILMLIWFYRNNLVGTENIHSILVESNKMCKCGTDDAFPLIFQNFRPSFTWPPEHSKEGRRKFAVTPLDFPTIETFPIKEVIT